MKTVAFFVLILATLALLAQETTVINVSESTVATGVVIIQGQANGKPAQLQCNQGSPNCKALKPGRYSMVVLPKNRGLYECQNAEVYPEASKPDNTGKLGQYCLSMQ
jgi:hypothetical protein